MFYLIIFGNQDNILYIITLLKYLYNFGRPSMPGIELVVIK